VEKNDQDIQDTKGGRVMKLVAFLIGFLLCTSLAFGADVQFQWGQSTGIVDGYRIYYGNSPAELAGDPYPEQLCEINGTTLNYMASLDETREYYLVCRAFNDYGESGNSNEVHWRYIPPPGIPENFHMIMDFAGRVEISFAPQTGETK
jgi:hypothetical protein